MIGIPKSDVIIALDFPDAKAVYAFLAPFQEDKPFVKVGMELFYAEGPQIVREIKARGHKIFLDLKLHDIPNTVQRAMHTLAKMEVDMANLHASGTIDMMKAAADGLAHLEGGRPLLLAVTQLTSTSEEKMQNELLINATMEQAVTQYARNAKAAGLDGVVCSPLEARRVKETCGADFVTVTPGIRFADALMDDQARIMTPAKARQSGSDFIVVGRPITQAADPVAVFRRCKKEFLGQ